MGFGELTVELRAARQLTSAMLRSIGFIPPL